MVIPELDVLLPSSENTVDGELPEFVLSNAHVVYESNGKPASLLAAYDDSPLRVQGRLEPLGRRQSGCLVHKPYKPVNIEIRGVTKFWYGQQVGGDVLIWAEGEAGSYLLRPARHYREIFEGMLEAVELLYFVADIYKPPRKKGSGPSAQLVFQEYAEDPRFQCSDSASAEGIFKKHYQFLMMRFLERAEDIGWSNTPIYQYWRRLYPNDFEALKVRKDGRYDDVSKYKGSVKPTAAPVVRQARSARSKPKSSAAPKKDDNWWGAAAIYEFIRSAVNKRALRPGRDHITLDRVAELMTKRYEIDEVETARHVLLVHAQNLCYKMDHPRSKAAAFLADEPIYKELEAGHDLPAADIRKAQGVELRPRRDHALLEEVESDTSDSESPEEVVEVVVTPKPQPDRRKKKGRLSVLRPLSSKFSGKGKSVKARKGPNVEEEKGRRKRAASSLSPESPPTSSESDTEGAAEADNEAPLPLRNRTNNTLTNGKSSEVLPKSELVAPIISTPLPTYEANGPRDSWLCTFDGCNQRIYGASKPVGQQLITEHLEDHAKGRQDVVGVVWRENQKLALPVNNLLKKIREMSESQRPLFPSLGSSSVALQPEPIRRML